MSRAIVALVVGFVGSSARLSLVLAASVSASVSSTQTTNQTA
jgi:hypothetical protein